MPSILVVDDDPLVRDALSVALPLSWPDASVVTARDGDEALCIFRDQEPNVVLLDIGLPGFSGFEVLRQIRQVSDVPVILLTDRDEETEQVRGLQAGADDVVVKPFSMRVLTARFHAVLHRSQPSPRARNAHVLEVGPLTLLSDRQEVCVQGRPAHLTPVEFALLHHLASVADQVVTYATLLTRLWGPASYRTADQLRVTVSRLQTKLERAGGPRCIENERGIGYRLVKPPLPS
jgi:DNA-binding response OmpR family regulator